MSQVLPSEVCPGSPLHTARSEVEDGKRYGYYAPLRITEIMSVATHFDLISSAFMALCSAPVAQKKKEEDSINFIFSCTFPDDTPHEVITLMACPEHFTKIDTVC